ncbi:hypothetical protein BQ8482_130229 [Mesorhizobium delmotii]|uniref:Uncharacterized protein n=1 Tax=Mesorhizobium delmotii TaxID=1631247 RepID=A0A2P9AGT7_9HYPH|nr:hypothetical protein BQ8482_130229 [Mesorhizobium delmotii]
MRGVMSFDCRSQPANSSTPPQLRLTCRRKAFAEPIEQIKAYLLFKIAQRAANGGCDVLNRAATAVTLLFTTMALKISV